MLIIDLDFEFSRRILHFKYCLSGLKGLFFEWHVSEIKKIPMNSL